MTPADEATFIALWQQGLSHEAMAQQLGIPVGTVKSRAHTLQQRGQIQARPRGGVYPTQRAHTRQLPADTTATAQTPVQKSAPVQNYAPVQTSVQSASPDLSNVLNALVERLAAIEARLPPGGVHSDAPVQSHAPMQEYAPVPTYALPGLEPPKLSAEDRKSERWNLYMPRWIRRRIERAAALEGLSPSQFVQRLCAPWAATWHDPEPGPE